MHSCCWLHLSWFKALWGEPIPSINCWWGGQNQFVQCTISPGRRAVLKNIFPTNISNYPQIHPIASARVWLDYHIHLPLWGHICALHSQFVCSFIARDIRMSFHMVPPRRKRNHKVQSELNNLPEWHKSKGDHSMLPYFIWRPLFSCIILSRTNRSSLFFTGWPVAVTQPFFWKAEKWGHIASGVDTVHWTEVNISPKIFLHNTP